MVIESKKDKLCKIRRGIKKLEKTMGKSRERGEERG